MIVRRLILNTLLLAVLPVGLEAKSQNSSAGVVYSDGKDCNKLPSPKELYECQAARSQLKTIYLKNVTTQTDANEIMVAVRNLLDPGVKIYLVTSQNALVINTDPEQMAKAEALISSLDRPHKTYRLTYTITELDAGKPIGTEHIAMVVVNGKPTTLKQGDKIPVATGSYSTDNNSAQTQFTYLDIGLNFDATVSTVENGAILTTKVEQSSLGQPSTIANVTEPVVRQTVLEGNTLLTAGKPVLIGSIDVPNSTHRFDIAVVMDAIK